MQPKPRDVRAEHRVDIVSIPFSGRGTAVSSTLTAVQGVQRFTATQIP